jgi:hypothetical protein
MWLGSITAMVKNEDDVPVFITGDEARAGLHEHRLHYVLAFGLAGGIIAFVAVGLYFGYGKLTRTLSQTSLLSEPTTLVYYAILIALAAVGTLLLLGLLLGLWNMMMGGSLNCAGGSCCNSSRFALLWPPSIYQVNTNRILPQPDEWSRRRNKTCFPSICEFVAHEPDAFR